MKMKISLTDKRGHESLYAIEQPHDDYNMTREFLQTICSEISFMDNPAVYTLRIERLE